MQQLVARLSALDPEAGSALGVITYFDTLVEGRAGLEALVRGAAVLSGHPAGLVDSERHVRLRVLPDGTVGEPPSAWQDGWPSAPVLDDGSGTIWLETSKLREIDELVLERLLLGVRGVFDRTRQRVIRDDSAALEVLLNLEVTDDVRLESARRLGWRRDSRIRAVALATEAPPAGAGRIGNAWALVLGADDRLADLPYVRTGIGSAVPVLEAARSWAEAREALRFTTNGTETDPGRRCLRYEHLGIVADLGRAFGRGRPEPADVVTLERAAAQAPWLFETLRCALVTNSRRAAAEEAHMHHSTMQDRIARAEALLGMSVYDPYDRLRIQLAMIARMLIREDQPS